MNIAVNNLSLAYDGHSLFEDVSFDVRPGQKYCISGPSGCGKSSLLRAMLGFVQPRQGDIVIDGLSPQGKDVWQVRHKIAYVTQEPDLGQQIVLDRIKQPFGYKANAHLQWQTEAVHEWFGRFNLPRKLLTKQTTDLSGGEKQRIAIIIALLLDRPLLLLDEPTSALDKQSKQILRGVLMELQKTVLFISHEDILLTITDAVLELAPIGGHGHE